MSMSGLGSGSWWLTSKSDPRWNTSGSVALMSAYGLPEGARKHIERMKEILGEEPPEDLTIHTMKD